MLTSVHGGTPRTECYTSPLTATGTTSSAGAKTFEQQLLNMIAASLERLAVEPENVPAAASRDTSQNEMAQSAKSQIFVSYAPTADVSSAASESNEPKSNSATSTATPVVSAATMDATSTSTEPEVLASLKAALKSAGHDPDKFNLTYQEQQVWYPDGSYIDRTVTATFSDGYKEIYGADLTAASPNAAVLSIEHTLRDIDAGTYS